MSAKSVAPALCFGLLISTATLAADEWGTDSWGEEKEAASPWHGFVEGAVGMRTSDDAVRRRDDFTLQELRGQLETQGYWRENRYSLKADLWADGVETGLHGSIREAMMDITLSPQTDLRVGRQVLTWGTGDLLFLNDMFPKDWVSYFSGRDDSYLKAPSDSVRASVYGEQANLEVVWTPVFAHDNFIDGERFSYFNPMIGADTASHLVPQYPEKRLNNGEFAARLYGRMGGTEWALYGYHGFWKQPNSMGSTGQNYFSPLNTVGASVRGNLAGGIANAEVAWYNGADDEGTDPMVPNNQARFLLGYERELIPNLTMGTQYYMEWQADYAALQASMAGSPYLPEEYRQLLTLRLNYRLWQDNLVLSWFSYWSPTDEDIFVRPSVSYRVDDHTKLTMGANLFSGNKPHTFFGQFEDASNLYLRLRYSF